jgi:hypothetical protein
MGHDVLRAARSAAIELGAGTRQQLAAIKIAQKLACRRGAQFCVAFNSPFRFDFSSFIASRGGCNSG